jgi:hypothetical protein
LAGAESLPQSASAPSGCMALLWGRRRRMASADRRRRQDRP